MANLERRTPIPRISRPSAPELALELRETPVVIDRVQPEIDGGAHAVKRVVGDVLQVEATLFKDGHDRLAAALRLRPRRGQATFEIAMRCVNPGLDLWAAEVALPRMGSFLYTVEAWVDGFDGWRDGVVKKRAARQSISVELLEGVRLLGDAIARCAPSGEPFGAPFTAEDARARETVERLLASLPKDPEQALLVLLDPGVVAFARRWQERRLRSRYRRELEVVVDRERARFSAWYELFPRSESPDGSHGTFRTAAARLPAIAQMGFDVVYLPPIHPIGETFRKGKNNALFAGPDDPGSPWAIGARTGGHTAVDPGLGTLADFDAFVAEARRLGLEIALDFALQCSPDHPWVKQHPDWFHHRADGTIAYAENPPKKYQDIYPIEFWGPHQGELWRALREVVRFWIARGVRAFRVDNPHTKPLAFWRWLIESVRDESPDVLFLAEAFTRPATMAALAKAGFSQSYSYFTWRNSKQELESYVSELTKSELAEYFRANFWPNTPDILHHFLVMGGRPAFKLRLVLAATLSSNYGIYAGYELCENVPLHEGSEEYWESEKYQLKPRDWSSPHSIAPFIAKVNAIRRSHRALQLYENVTFHDAEDDDVLVYSKATPAKDDVVIVAVNLDPKAPRWSWIDLDVDALGVGDDERYDVHDLLSGETWTWHGGRAWVRLEPDTHPCHVFEVRRRG